MKRFLLLTLLSPILWALTASAYVPMIREDRVWEYCGPFLSEEASGLVFHYMKFDGTMDVQGTEYHKFVLFKSIYESGDEYFKGGPREDLYYLLREEEGKVFALCQNGRIVRNYSSDSSNASENLSEFKLYDFTLSDGEAIEFPSHTWLSDNPQTYYVKILPSPDIDGQECKSMALTGSKEEYNDYPIKLVEGIGVTRNGSLVNFCLELYQSITDNSYEPGIDSSLNRVFNADGTVIYQDRNFTLPPSPNYVPMIREDRVWEYTGRYSHDREMGYAYHYMKFDGTQEVMGKEYHRFVLFKSTYVYWDVDLNRHCRIEWRNEPAYLLREEDGKVYALYQNNCLVVNYNPENADANENLSEFKLYDFTLSDGDTLEYPFHTGAIYDSRLYTVRIQPSVSIAGEECRVMRLESQMNPEYEIPIDFIEGVGINLNGSMASFGLDFITGDGNSYYAPGYWARLNRLLDLEGNVLYGDGKAPFSGNDPAFNEDWTYRYEVKRRSEDNDNRIVSRYVFDMKFNGTTEIDGVRWHNFTTVGNSRIDYRTVCDDEGYLEMRAVDTVPGPVGRTFLVRERNGHYYGRLPLDDGPDSGNSWIPWWTPDMGEGPLYSFRAHEGDSFSIFTGDRVKVESESFIHTDTADLKVMHVTALKNEGHSTSFDLIEGIGFIDNGILPFPTGEIPADQSEDSAAENTFALPSAACGQYLVNVRDSDGKIVFWPGMLNGERSLADRVFNSGYTWRYVNNDITSSMEGDREIWTRHEQDMAFCGTEEINGTVWHRFTTTRNELIDFLYEPADGDNLKMTDIKATPVEEVMTFLIRAEGRKWFVRLPENPVFPDRYWWVYPGTPEMELYDFSADGSFTTLSDRGVKKTLEVTSVSAASFLDTEVAALHTESGHEIVEGVGVLDRGMLPFVTMPASTGGPIVDSQKGLGSWRLKNVTDPDKIIVFKPSSANGGDSVDGIFADSLTLGRDGNVVTATSEAGTRVTVEVTGVDGAKRLAASGDGFATADLSTLAPGVYVVRASDGQSVRTMKLRK